jgi:hypothetical protein
MKKITVPMFAGLVLVLAAIPVLAATYYFQGFETDTADWSGATRVASGTNSVASSAGDWHALAANGAFTRFGGYESTFPVGGYKTSIDIYLDPNAVGYTNDMRFDWSSAISTPADTHRRDFIFNAGFYNDNDTSPQTGQNRFVVSASNNSSPGSAFPKNPGREPFTITVPGWYTFEHSFSDNAGYLSVALKISKDGTVQKTWFLSDLSDTIGTGGTVGGHRYGWFDYQQVPSLAIDNVSLRSPFNFTGFFEPVNNGDVVNTVKAGSSIPVKFSLSGDQGLNILDGNPQIQFTNCGPEPLDAIETTTAGNSSLTYDPVTDQYTYVWKTDKSWKGQCGTLVLYLIDGTQHTAKFQFK